jgi:hypothetical protein
MTDDAPLTMSIPEAGKKYYGLGRTGSYDAAERGEIPVIRVGRLLRVPVRAMERILDNPTYLNAPQPKPQPKRRAAKRR